jgi:hypothetical protein
LIVTMPKRGGINPLITFNSVDLPMPFGPERQS